MSHRHIALACGFVATSALSGSVWAGPDLSYEGKETSNRTVTMDQVPEAARQTLLAQAGTNPIRELEEKVVDGQTVYEIELRLEGKEVEVVVAPDGKLVRVKRGERDTGSHRKLVASLDRNRDQRRKFDVDRKRLGPDGYNPYFPLTVGLKIHLSDGDKTLVFSVLNETKVVDGVETRVVEEHETRGGELIEISRNYYAIDQKNGDVYYFGEDVDIYENGKVIRNDGAWISGVDGATFGLMMPGKPGVGDRFYFEMAPGAVERVEIADTSASLETPARHFSGVLHAREFDELDGGTSTKWYAPGIGMVGDDALRAVKVELAIE